MTFIYTIFNRVLASNIRFPELEFEGKDSEALSIDKYDKISLQVTHANLLFKISDIAWKPFWVTPAGSAWLKLARLDNGKICLLFPRLLVAEIDADQCSIRCAPLHSTPVITIRHLVLDQIIPLVASLSGALIMHMAVLRIGAAGVGFVGVSGSGKSTLSAEFANNGYQLLSDDCVLLKEENGRYYAFSNYAGIRLWKDSFNAMTPDVNASTMQMAHYSEKLRVVPESYEFNRQQMLPLDVLFSVESDSQAKDRGISISSLSFQDTIQLLLKNKFRIDTSGSDTLSQEFKCLVDLANSVQCKQLCYPRDYNSLPLVRTAVESYLK